MNCGNNQQFDWALAALIHSCCHCQSFELKITLLVLVCSINFHGSNVGWLVKITFWKVSGKDGSVSSYFSCSNVIGKAVPPPSLARISEFVLSDGTTNQPFAPHYYSWLWCRGWQIRANGWQQALTNGADIRGTPLGIAFRFPPVPSVISCGCSLKARWNEF